MCMQLNVYIKCMYACIYVACASTKYERKYTYLCLYVCIYVYVEYLVIFCCRSSATETIGAAEIIDRAQRTSLGGDRGP